MINQADIVPGVRKIGVLRANALGDFIFTLPALDALRAAYRDAEIVLFGKQWHAELLDGRPGPIDRVIVIPTIRGVGVEPNVVEDAAEVDRFFADMQRERFDLAIQFQGGGGYSNPFLLRLGAHLTVGLQTPDAAPLDRSMPYVFWQNEIMRYLEVVACVGAAPVTLEPRLGVTERDLAEAQATVPELDRPLVGLHPGAGDPRRRWPTDKFAAVGDALAAAGAQVVVTGIAAEQALVDAVVSAMRSPALNLGGRLSIGGLAGLLARCRVVVSNDSGPLHLAGSVGASTVGIYWCGNLITFGPITRTRHRQALSWRLNCPTCGADCMYAPCQHRPSFVADVRVEEVVEAALELFAAASN